MRCRIPANHIRFQRAHKGGKVGSLVITSELLPAGIELVLTARTAATAWRRSFKSLLTRVSSGHRLSYGGDRERQKAKPERRPWFNGLVEVGHKMEERMAHSVAASVNPHRWGKAIWQNAVVAPASCLPAVSQAFF